MPSFLTVRVALDAVVLKFEIASRFFLSAEVQKQRDVLGVTKISLRQLRRKPILVPRSADRAPS